MISFDNLLNPQGGEDFYKAVLDHVPAFIYINEFSEPANYQSMRMTWLNKSGEDFIGCSKEDAFKMGFELYHTILHPDDLEIIKYTTDAAMSVPTGSQYIGMQRVKHKEGKDYKWLYGKGMLIETFDCGRPKKSLNVYFEITSQMHTENQLIEALKEVNQLKNELQLGRLGKREREILALIARGYTDKEIGARINISLSTAKTHRNNIIKKLGFRNTASLVAFAVNCGL